ncbi:MAG: hypothetical protein CSA97_06035 [Bacteroidetes bacterium]|nr:MAG: hypothetical protein CSA97_06035 [Bacteroidota bacterium]
MEQFWHSVLALEGGPRILVGILGVVLLLDILLLCLVYLRAAFKSIAPLAMTSDMPMVSVIVCLRDGYEEFEANQRDFLEQRYPNYELVLVDNTGSEEVEMALEQLRRQDAHVRVCTVNPESSFTANRKYALAIGIKAAQGEWIVLTESGCRPATHEWLNHLSKHFTPATDVILGYGALENGAGLAGLHAQAHARWHALGRFGFALSGKFFLGQRRNMAFRRELFFARDGYKGYTHIPGGDDDLFTLAVAQRGRSVVEVCPDALTVAPGLTSWSEWRRKRLVDASSHSLYPSSVRLWMRMEGRLRYLVWGGALSLAFAPQAAFYLGLGAILARFLLLNLVLLLAKYRLGMHGGLLFAWGYDVVGPLINWWTGRGVRHKQHKAWR